MTIAIVWACDLFHSTTGKVLQSLMIQCNRNFCSAPEGEAELEGETEGEAEGETAEEPAEPAAEEGNKVHKSLFYD